MYRNPLQISNMEVFVTLCNNIKWLLAINYCYKTLFSDVYDTPGYAFADCAAKL